MPLITFNFVSSNVLGDTQQFTQVVTLPYRIPAQARFTLKQVSASTTSAFPTAFKYVIVNFPELINTSDHVYTHHFIASGTGLVSTSGEQGLRFYMTDPTPEPYAIQHFPNLNMGRHSLPTNQVTLIIRAVTTLNQTAPLQSYSVVLEWDTE